MSDLSFRLPGRAVWYEILDEMQIKLDNFLLRCNRDRPHQSRGMNGRTPPHAFLEGLFANYPTIPEIISQPLAA